MKGIFTFVVHEHKATTLHYDFRLEIDEAMPSWALPKGPSLDPKEKRLAMKVDDHSLEYQNFEGVISEGSYGSGPVMIWDNGTYLPEMEVTKGERQAVSDRKEALKVMQEGLEKGGLKFQLFGRKLHGSFALVKVNFGPKNSWLMIKHKDEFVQSPYDINQFKRSVVSNKTIEEII